MLSAGWRSPAATDCRLHRHDVLRSAAWKSFRLGELLDLEFVLLDLDRHLRDLFKHWTERLAERRRQG